MSDTTPELSPDQLDRRALTRGILSSLTAFVPALLFASGDLHDAADTAYQYLTDTNERISENLLFSASLAGFIVGVSIFGFALGKIAKADFRAANQLRGNRMNEV